MHLVMNVIDIVVGGGFGGVGLVGRSTGWKTHKNEKFPLELLSNIVWVSFP